MGTFGCLGCCFVGNALVALGAWAAYQDDFLFLWQMKKKGFSKGMPFIRHEGMWGDLLIITPLAASIVGAYADQWLATEWLKAGVLGVSTSAVLHFGVYARGVLPESHVYKKVLTHAGWAHLWYMALAFMVFILFFFFTARVPAAFVITASVLVACHIFLGSHIVTSIAAPEWFDARSHREPFCWLSVIGAWFLIGWRCVVMVASH